MASVRTLPTCKSSSSITARRTHVPFRPAGVQRRHAPLAIRASSQDDFEETLKADMERLGARAQQKTQQPQVSQPSPVKDALDKVLIADFFFVLLVGAWLAAGVAENAVFRSSNLLDVWYPLWPMVFQPAIGVLMLGSLVSGVTGWLASQKQS